MNDAYLLTGQVMHERLRPVRNRFVYPVFCVRLRLDKLATLQQPWFGVDRWGPLSIRQRDYGARDGSDLDTWMRATLLQHGIALDGAIWLQTFPRIFGYVFNPVSFWYCHNMAGELIAVLAEVTNTFGEHHNYLLTAAQGEAITAETPIVCQKAFHVSPFCPVEGHYQFRLRETSGTSFMGIDYHDAEGLLIRTAIAGRIMPFSATNLRRALFGMPFLTLGVIVRIHLQALRLWRGKVQFFRKPTPPSHPITVASPAGVRP